MIHAHAHAHADVVGSLLRPPELLQAREEKAAGRLGQAEFKIIEDRAVDEAVALQEQAGVLCGKISGLRTTGVFVTCGTFA